jgi:hypothetical protein
MIKEQMLIQNLNEMRFKRFSPNKMVTLRGHLYSSLYDVSSAYNHTLNVLQRKAFGRYGKQKIKHFSIAEIGTKYSSYGKNAHIHSLIELDASQMNEWEWGELLKDIWVNTRTGTSVGLTEKVIDGCDSWFKDVWCLSGAVQYLLKNSNDAEKWNFIKRKY